MRILITGGSGMLGRTLARTLTEHDCIPANQPDFELTDADGVDRFISQANADCVIHCAAMTDVDGCESRRDAAFAINAEGSKHVARACHRTGTRLIHISTDYVFDGATDHPYAESDPVGPATVYGASKLAGEEYVRAECPDHLILRIAWLYGQGGPSFVHTMLRLGAQEGAPLKVVDDQVGNPTSTTAVAERIRLLLDGTLTGTVHCTCEGEATWYHLTAAIFEHMGFERGLIPCSSDEYPRPAPRPKNSRLDKAAFRAANLPPMPHWRDELTRFLTDFPNG